MYLRIKAADRDALTAALKACGAGFTVEVPASEAPDTALSVTTEEGDPAVEVTRYYVIVEASHRHAIIHGLSFDTAPAVLDEEGAVVTPAVLATGYHADLTGDHEQSVIQAILEANGVTVLDPSTPQHVIG